MDKENPIEQAPPSLGPELSALLKTPDERAAEISAEHDKQLAARQAASLGYDNSDKPMPQAIAARADLASAWVDGAGTGDYHGRVEMLANRSLPEGTSRDEHASGLASEENPFISVPAAAAMGYRDSANSEHEMPAAFEGRDDLADAWSQGQMLERQHEHQEDLAFESANVDLPELDPDEGYDMD